MGDEPDYQAAFDEMYPNRASVEQLLATQDWLDLMTKVHALTVPELRLLLMGAIRTINEGRLGDDEFRAWLR